MNVHNHLRLIEHYHQYEKAIKSLMESMMTSIADFKLMHNRDDQVDAIKRLCKHYPFVELIYSLDCNGVQLMDTVCSPDVSYRKRREPGKGQDRNHRPYMVAARQSENKVSVTDPYLSSATFQLAISSVQVITDEGGGEQGYLVLNYNLQRLISYLKGDQARARIHPIFQAVYGVIGGLLIVVSMLLLYAGAESFMQVFDFKKDITTGAFSIVILVTLGLAIFDLGKTILEEEVLANKDIHHHDTSRRTITRFMSAIIIAVSIESLLLMFKSLLANNGGQVLNAVWMLMAAVGLLIGLGIYLKLSQE